MNRAEIAALMLAAGLNASRKLYVTQVGTSWGPDLFMPSWDNWMYTIEYVKMERWMYRGPGGWGRIHKHAGD